MTALHREQKAEQADSHSVFEKEILAALGTGRLMQRVHIADEIHRQRLENTIRTTHIGGSPVLISPAFPSFFNPFGILHIHWRHRPSEVHLALVLAALEKRHEIACTRDKEYYIPSVG